jgi:hypothetical protein
MEEVGPKDNSDIENLGQGRAKNIIGISILGSPLAGTIRARQIDK